MARFGDVLRNPMTGVVVMFLYPRQGDGSFAALVLKPSPYHPKTTVGDFLACASLPHWERLVLINDQVNWLIP